MSEVGSTQPSSSVDGASSTIPKGPAWCTSGSCTLVLSSLVLISRTFCHQNLQLCENLNPKIVIAIH